MVKVKRRFVMTVFFIAAMLSSLLFTGNAAISMTGKENSEAKIAVAYGKLPLSFIQNDGQTDKKVKFYERGSGHSTYFTEEGVYLQLVTGQGSEVRGHKKDKLSADKKRVKSELVKLIPRGANPSPKIIAEGPQEGKVNYFIGNDPEKWKTNIPTYREVVYKDLYKGIDIKFYGNNRQLEYDILIKPGADPSQVRLKYEGIKGLKVTEAGDLEITLKEGSITQKKPIIYQEIDGKKVEVKGQFIVHGSKFRIKGSQPVFGFEVASYNKKYPLIIDPVLSYSTYLGGGDYDSGFGIALDGSGNAYVTGQTLSTNFPTQDPFQGSNAGSSDAFVTKINAAGTARVYSTYLGGGDEDVGYGIALDGSGNAYVTGVTQSTNFPMQGPIQGTNAGNGDVFVTKINSFGSALVYSTYLGGSDGMDEGHGMAVDGSGNAYVTGVTQSTNFPMQGPIQGTNGGGGYDAFVTKINSSGTLPLVYSTYLGGSSGDYGYGIAVDGSGNAYVTGGTASTNFSTQGPIQGTNGGGASDAFVTKINSSGSLPLVYSTYLGGSGGDYGRAIALDGSGNAYVTGGTDSTNFPTQGPIQGTNAGNGDAFVTKINSSGTSPFVYSTYLGGGNDDAGRGIAVDSSGNAYVTGGTASTNFPTQDPFQGSNAGSSDAFVAKINAGGTARVYSTYLGGGNEDAGRGIAVDGSGNAYVTGGTDSTNFPTQDPFQGSNAGSSDVFVVKITEQAGSFDYYCDNDADTYIDSSSDGTCVGIGCEPPGCHTTPGDDCDDSDPLEHPNQTWYQDTDNDLYSSGDMTVQCLRPAGYKASTELTATSGDCNDGNAAINPGATEICDGVDNDCEGGIDEGLPTATYYRDADSDTYGDAGILINACSQPAGYVVDNTDCDDGNDQIHPGATEICDGIDNNCDGQIDEGCGGPTAFKLPDTGQTKCYRGIDPYDEIPCAGTGQDGAYNINPMSYTDNGDGTVTDNNTGLMWQQDENPTTYNWYQASGTYDATYNPLSQDVCGELTTGGYTDWRLPTKKELMSIVDYSIPSPVPTINTTYFPNANASYYWSSTTFASYPDYAWHVYFGNGYVLSYGKYNFYDVRCVRGGELDFGNFIDNHDGTISDTSTGLMWQQAEPGEMTWSDALNYCENLALPPGSGQTDWRLPNIKELESITDDTRYDPAIDTTFFQIGAIWNFYWSSTTHANYTNYAWGVLFYDGYVSYYSKYDSSYVRCVRGGVQSFDYYCDSDGDTYFDSSIDGTLPQVPAGCQTTPGTDCNDSDAAINPGMTEVPGDGIDNNCNGQIDEGCGGTTLSFPFYDDFESGLCNWIDDWGLTTSDARSVTHSATDSPGGDYLDNTDASLTLAHPIDLTGTVSPVVSFWYKGQTDCSPNGPDDPRVEVSQNGGLSWDVPRYYGCVNNPTWARELLDLSGYKTSEVLIRFRLLADGDGATGDGWYIDDVEIKEKDTVRLSYPFSDNFENGFGNWTVSGYDWDLTTSDARSTTHSATDSPNGDYLDNTNASLTLAHPIDLTGTVSPVVSFWYKGNTDCSPNGPDSPIVEASDNGGLSWDILKNYDCVNNPTWAGELLDLSGYKTSEVLIRFRLIADGDGATGDGWYIDDVTIKEKDPSTTPFPFFDNFEIGLSNWEVSGYDWDLTTSDARSTTHSATDSPNGDYLDNTNASLTLAHPIDLTGFVYPVVSFWYKGNTDCSPNGPDSPIVEASDDGGLSWDILKSYDCVNNPTWINDLLDLSSYKTPSVLIRFRLLADGDGATGDGWYIDDVEIKELNGPIANLVIYYYNSILNRAPEPGGVFYWTLEIERVVSLGIDIKEGFIALGKLFFNSGEYLSMNTTDNAYVIDLYETFLGRTPSQGEADYWAGELSGGLTRNLLLNYFIFSAEFKLYMDGIFGDTSVRPEYNLVNDLYRGFLSRLPDDVGFNSWLVQMQDAQCNGNAQAIRDLTSQTALGFLNSQEYADRNTSNSEYMEDLYNGIMRRGADLAGYLYWLGELNGGVYTRPTLLTEFVNSLEFQARVTEVINAGCSP
ncbi:MAG: SBBP repeat-containing protein [Nitrospirae bacterium]|nr:SBBP repeat-containing protein [Nitrospirota bacterium]